MADQQKTILIVEDDFELCELLAQAVRDQSDAFDVKATRNVDEAMAHVRRFQERQRAFDLVITDIKMSGLSGLELLEVLNSISPATKTIVMTAYNSSELAERAQELNVYAYLTKPFIISEFRRIVQDAIASPEPGIAPQLDAPSQPILSAAQKRAASQKLATLRGMTGATMALLIDRSGAVLALDSLEPNAKLDNLSEALMIAQYQVAQQMTSDLGTDVAIRQSYFGTDKYNICTYQVNTSLYVAVIFGPAVKEGQVWYYLRDMVDEITVALESEDQEPENDGSSVKDELMAMLDQYAPAQGGRRSSRRMSSREASRAAQQRISQPAPEAPVEPKPVQKPVVEPKPQVSIPEPDISVDDINWDVGEDAEWDTLVADTPQGFSGISLDQAQQQGLFPSNTAAAPAPDQGPPVDEIDWNASLDMDWDELVAEADQGFGGLNLDEAQQKGIIDDLDPE